VIKPSEVEHERKSHFERLAHLRENSLLEIISQNLLWDLWSLCHRLIRKRWGWPSAIIVGRAGLMYWGTRKRERTSVQLAAIPHPKASGNKLGGARVLRCVVPYRTRVFLPTSLFFARNRAGPSKQGKSLIAFAIALWQYRKDGQQTRWRYPLRCPQECPWLLAPRAALSWPSFSFFASSWNSRVRRWRLALSSTLESVVGHEKSEREQLLSVLLCCE